MSGLNKWVHIFAWGYIGAAMLPGLALVMLLILVILYNIGFTALLIMLLLIVFWGWLITKSVDYQEEDLPRRNPPNGKSKRQTLWKLLW